MHYPGLIKNRCGVYCYRLIFPPFLRQLGAPREVRFSLGTKSRSQTGELWIHAFKIGRLLLDELTELSQETDMAEFSSLLRERIAVKRELIRQQHQAEIAAEQLTRQIERHQLIKTKAAHDELQKKYLILAGQLSEARRKPIPATIATPQVVIEPALPLADLVERFLVHCENIEKLAPKTLNQRRSNLERFLDIIGPLESQQLNASHIRHYRDVIHSLPKNLTKKRELWAKRPLDPSDRPSWYKSLASVDMAKIGEQGQDTHFSDVRPFLLWIKTERFIDSDFTDMLIPIKDDPDSREESIPFSAEDVAILVRDHLLPGPKQTRNQRCADWHFWSVLIGLTTGLRGNEIGALTVSDIHEIDGIAVFTVPGTKNPNAKRHLPIPEVLLRAGLMTLVETAKKNGSERLFPDLVLSGKKNAKDYSTTLGKWFNRQVNSKDGIIHYSGRVLSLGLWKEDHQVSFHSLRHTFITRAYHSGVDVKTMQAAAGHGADLAGTYGLAKSLLPSFGSAIDYLKLDTVHAGDRRTALLDMKAALDSINFGYPLDEVNWLAWKSSPRGGMKTKAEKREGES